jgi:hypothetical protein
VWREEEEEEEEEESEGITYRCGYSVVGLLRCRIE